MTPPPRRPQDALPPLLPGTARRLVRLDVLRPAQDGGHRTIEVVASARDEVGTAAGPVLVDVADLRVRAVGGQVVSVDCTPALDLAPVVGGSATSGFRRTAQAALASAVERGDLADPRSALGPSPLEALLDDVPVAVLVSGYLDVRAGRLGTGAGGYLTDICSGWRRGGAPLERALTTDVVPVSELTPVGSHDLDPSLPGLPAGALRRVRWITVDPAAGERAVSAGFRDSAREGEGPEGVLHEYSLTAGLDEAGRLDALEAEPRVLPFETCLQAVPGVARLNGRVATQLPAEVPSVLPGTLGCSHLNDLLRAVACAPRLAAAAHAATAPPTPAVLGRAS